MLTIKKFSAPSAPELVVQAVQFTEDNYEDVVTWVILGLGIVEAPLGQPDRFKVWTNQARWEMVKPGAWVVRNAKGGFAVLGGNQVDALTPVDSTLDTSVK